MASIPGERTAEASGGARTSAEGQHSTIERVNASDDEDDLPLKRQRRQQLRLGDSMAPLRPLLFVVLTMLMTDLK